MDAAQAEELELNFVETKKKRKNNIWWFYSSRVIGQEVAAVGLALRGFTPLFSKSPEQEEIEEERVRESKMNEQWLNEWIKENEIFQLENIINFI